jgi:hypothetical protein
VVASSFVRRYVEDAIVETVPDPPLSWSGSREARSSCSFARASVCRRTTTTRPATGWRWCAVGPIGRPSCATGRGATAVAVLPAPRRGSSTTG